ncbi:MULTISPECIES: heme exporter protein CcmD [unclassified Stenotrophomonas]|uniref:heme exporter protein CcmD n=1 Tax=unclassified Stenotrophomonas TaxID=196198 RepID=UPI002117652D|nr:MULTISPECIES: heme exporter protein CcmD [unclassified Stenotrophomonas]
MTHLPFITAAFAVFGLVLCCDAFGSWLRLRLARWQARHRQQRLQARAKPPSSAMPATELSR